MEGRITFYTYGDQIELNGQRFVAGELTADLLNLSPERYGPIHSRFERVRELAQQFQQDRRKSTWWELNEEMKAVCAALRRYTVFRILLSEDDILFSDAQAFTEQYSMLPDGDLIPHSTQLEEDAALERFSASLPTPSDPPDSIAGPLPDDYEIAAGVFIPGLHRWNWEQYRTVMERYERYLHDIRAFNGTIRNFIRHILSKLETNSPEEYAKALYCFYHDERLADKLIVNPIRNGSDCYTVHDSYMLSYVPRELPDGSFVISQEHITDSLQALMKADYILALNCGYNIHRCLVCGSHFLVRSGVHALYCEGPCPHAPRFTCRQFGTHEVQKELAKDIPKIRKKLTAFSRINKDMQRGNITREDARAAKDDVRDRLYDALRDAKASTEEFAQDILPERVYSRCGITRTMKQRGRPRKKADGDAP